LGDAFKHESRIVRKPKTGIERWVTDEYTPICSDFAELGKAILHESSTDATMLQLGFDRNWTKPIPARGAIADGYRGKRNMPYDAAGIFGDKSD